MPNICFGSVTVRGYKDNVDEFTRIIQAHYNYNLMEFSHKPHLFRVFDATIIFEEINGVEKVVIYNIECAWSIASCMLNDFELDYYNTLKERYKNEFCGTYLEEQARRLNLWIQAWGEESGMGFQEHYLINNFGTRLIDECANDYMEINIYEYDNVNDLNSDYNYNMSEEDFNIYKSRKDEWIRVGGFDDYGEDYTNMCKPILIVPIKKTGGK